MTKLGSEFSIDKDIKKEFEDKNKETNGKKNTDNNGDNAEGQSFDFVESEIQKLQNDISNLTAENVKLKEEIDKLKDQILRIRANEQNVIRQAEREKNDAILFGNQSLIKSLVGPVDQLFLALLNKPTDDSDVVLKNLYQGVDITKNEFIKVLEKTGLKRVYPNVGDTFNPEYHQAISMVEKESEDEQSNSVKNVVQAGWELSGRLIKPAMVVVTK
jgi:molecular chaperone GrpE